MRELDAYATPAEVRGNLWSRLPFGASLVLYGHFFDELRVTRWLSGKGAYDSDAWIRTGQRFIRAIEQSGGRVDIRGLGILRRQSQPRAAVPHVEPSRAREEAVLSRVDEHARQPLPYGRGSDQVRARR